MNRSELAEKLKDPLFRINNAGLYNIVTKTKDEKGRDVSSWSPFRPFEHQRVLNGRIVSDGWRRVLVPKARRMGFSTDINILQLDACLNNDNFHSKIVDMSQADATDKLVNRCQRAFDFLQSKVDTGLTVVKKNERETKWSNGSMFTADTSGRGGSAVQFLHVSELGPIDFEDAKRADEIIDGAFNAADGGIIVVESTAKGPIGHFKRLVDNALSIPKDERTPMDWHVLFFAWHDDPRHTLTGKYTRTSNNTHEYCDWVESETGKKLSEGQRLWYHVKREEAANVKYEYPSTLAECWEQPIEGAIFAKDMNKARADGRVGKFPYESALPVYTIWDLGAPANTRVVFFQQIQGEIRIIDAAMGGHDEISGMDGPRSPSDWANLLRERGYNYGNHILPHDGNIKQYGGNSFKTDLQKAGIANIVTMDKRGNDPWQRIRPTWGAFERFVFNTQAPGVVVLIKHLESYKTKKEHDGITVKEKPHHDWASHHADAFSSIIEAINRGFTNDGTGYGPKKNKRRKQLKMKTYSAYA